MKTVIASLALSAISLQAYAQSSLQIYGIVDVAVERLNKTATGSGVTRMATTSGRAASRLGFRGEEKISPGLSALYTLEMGIAPDSGTLNQGGRAFGRQAWTGLKTDFGTLSLGRQYTMLLWAFGNSDITGGSMHGLGSLDSYLAAARVDNSIAYRTSFQNFDMGLTYSFGRDAMATATNNCVGENAQASSECTQWSAMVKYDNKDWGAGLGVDEYRGGPRAAGGLTAASMKDRRVLVNAYKMFGGTRLGGGVIVRKDEGLGSQPNTNLWYFGVAHKLNSQLTLDAQVSAIHNTANDNDAKLLVLRATHAFSKRTSVYTSFGYVKNDGLARYSASSSHAGGLPTPGTGQAALSVGLFHSF